MPNFQRSMTEHVIPAHFFGFERYSHPWDNDETGSMANSGFMVKGKEAAPYQNSWEMRGNGNAATPQRRDTNLSQPDGAAPYPKGEGKMAGASTNSQLFKGSLVLVVLVIVVQQVVFEAAAARISHEFW
ncbi:hypothetical protein DFP73DRAFT_527759 [Morchella snyderi]|nr:hypothetical protein DFP73DRAFT_527759 [Morchella snyderi]